MIDPAPIRDRFTALSPHLNERERRLFAATEAAAAGYGGIVAISGATGIAVSTIGRGLKTWLRQVVCWQAGCDVRGADASHWSSVTLTYCAN